MEVDFPIAGAPEEMRLPALRVLVADDDPDTCRSAACYLRELGARADVAFDGREAVQKAAEAAESGDGYDLILLDLSLLHIFSPMNLPSSRSQTI